MSEDTFEMEPTGTIFISLKQGIWIADFSHTSIAARLHKANGGTWMPTPFSSRTPVETVRATIMDLNQGCDVKAIA